MTNSETYPTSNHLLPEMVTWDSIIALERILNLICEAVKYDVIPIAPHLSLPQYIDERIASMYYNYRPRDNAEALIKGPNNDNK